MSSSEDMAEDAPPDYLSAEQICFRPTEVQERYLSDYLKKGWKKSRLMHRLLDGQMALETLAHGHLERLELWGVENRVIMPRSRREAGDIIWLSEVVIRLALMHLDALAKQKQADTLAGRK